MATIIKIPSADESRAAALCAISAALDVLGMSETVRAIAQDIAQASANGKLETTIVFVCEYNPSTTDQPNEATYNRHVVESGLLDYSVAREKLNRLITLYGYTTSWECNTDGPRYYLTIDWRPRA